MATYPDVKSEIVNGVTETDGNSINQIEDYLGIKGDVDTNSITYKLTNPVSVGPGHRHNVADLYDGGDGNVLWKDPSDHLWKPVVLATAGLLARAGDTMSGNLNMDSHKVTGLAAASGTGEAVRYDEWIAAQDPGHKHSGLWASDGSPQGVSVDADGVVTIATPTSGGSQGEFRITGQDFAFNMIIASVDVSKYAYMDYMFCLYNPSAPVPLRPFCSFGAEGEYTDAGVLSWWDFYLGSGGLGFTLDSNGNFQFNSAGLGSNAAKVLAIKSGTAPTTAPADTVQFWAADINGAAGYCGLHKRTETTDQPEVVPGVIIKTDTGSPANPYEGLMEINTFDNKVRMYADGGWRELGTW